MVQLIGIKFGTGIWLSKQISQTQTGSRDTRWQCVQKKKCASKLWSFKPLGCNWYWCISNGISMTCTVWWIWECLPLSRPCCRHHSNWEQIFKQQQSATGQTESQMADRKTIVFLLQIIPNFEPSPRMMFSYRPDTGAGHWAADKNINFRPSRVLCCEPGLGAAQEVRNILVNGGILWSVI